MDLIPNPNIPINIIFEDDSIIIIDKPAAMPVYPLKEGETGTLANGLIAKWPKLLGVGFDDLQAGLVHRLDNNTSGVTIVAKRQTAFKEIRAQFDNETILKEYTALVIGETPSEGIINVPIIHDPRNRKKMKVQTVQTVQPEPFEPPSQVERLEPFKHSDIFTTYKLLKKYLAGQYSLLQIQIKTGVRHQIRVHLASFGHPIVGDKLYQNSCQRSYDKIGLKRQFLHASRIGFNHPTTKKWIEFNSALPKELQKVLTKLECI